MTLGAPSYGSKAEICGSRRPKWLISAAFELCEPDFAPSKAWQGLSKPILSLERLAEDDFEPCEALPSSPAADSELDSDTRRTQEPKKASKWLKINDFSPLEHVMANHVAITARFAVIWAQQAEKYELDDRFSLTNRYDRRISGSG